MGKRNSLRGNLLSEPLASMLWLALTLIVLIILIKLSLWQYDRGFEKEQRSIRIEQLNQSSPLTLNEVVQLSQAKQFIGKESVNDLPVTVDGDFSGDYLFLLDNQVEERSLGYRVLQVVETSTHAVLVNLGWIPGSINRNILPEVTPLHGQYKFTGHVRVVEQGIMLMDQDFSQPSWPLRVQQIELTKFSALISPLVDKPLLPFVIYVDKNESIGYKKNWHPIVMPAAKHFGYSFQWAALAIAWLVLMVSLRIKTRRQRNINPHKLSSI
ncbi:SURF1 family protein [Colwellia echini]|uniref:SURF1-like protein n=1 Tax=Colwellia echini TaxID=1982103 RepID=A0ABY3MZD5_9GAMM|nr:SURF1 family protein [Colwellia echini]TYK66572.1 SURF1 family protein [Colwellia echini]